MFPVSLLFTKTHRPFFFFIGKPHFLHHHRRLLSTHSLPSPIEYTLSHPIYTIWAANTGLGKTLVSAGLAASFFSPPPHPLSSPSKFIYIKPVQTGFPSDSDSHFVYSKFCQLFLRTHSQSTLLASNHTLRVSIPAAKASLGTEFGEECESGFRDLGYYEERKMEIMGGEVVKPDVGVSELICKTMYAWREAVSPHLAAEREDAMVDDSALLDMLKRCLMIGLEEKSGNAGTVMTLIETAGGVASPGPSGSLQCDLYRPFRLPAILVGDGRLGGISGTISAYESLILRGYDVVAVIFEDHGLLNEVPLSSYLQNRVPVLVLPPVPKDVSDDLIEWFEESQSVFSSLKDTMLSAFLEKKQRLHDMPKKAREIFWWPFTQHKFVPQDTVTVIDSRCGENFAVHKVQNNDVITQQFDACASWWTQGPNAALQIELARDMGYTAARYGHVMFPENVYEPALACAELLLQGVGRGWASRVYFSDNGSTSIEIALKMAFRKFSVDNELEIGEKPIELKVLALRGSYHGDTLGAMEAQAPSAYTGFLQQPWYTGRGCFLDPPSVYMSSGNWKLSLPQDMQSEKLINEDISFGLRDEIFNKRRDGSRLAGIYSSYISQALSLCSGPKEFTHIGALIIEPVIHGAGGMQMIDPLFQRILVNECRIKKIPVIFDEVFTGFWRLGVESAAELLGCEPDIACFAKLMTGGIIPLSATIATSSVFDAFVGDSKLKALLHGHSYSAHAMGCSAAVKSIKWFKDPQTNPNLISQQNQLVEMWDMELVNQISLHEAVERVVALGTLFALELQAQGPNAGYASLYARSLLDNLREDGIYTRPLGNVIYLMCGPCTSPSVCSQLLERLYLRLDVFNQENKLKACQL